MGLRRRGKVGLDDRLIYDVAFPASKSK